jgi:type IV pilus assembly PilN-like protein
VRALSTLAEAVPLLRSGDRFVLGLPINAVLTQRLRLPTADPQEFREMVRIQVEKALPYSADEVTSDYEIIQAGDSESVVSAVAVHNERLDELAAPLLSHGYIPSQVTVYAAQRGATHAAEGQALLIYHEGGTLVSAITENGKLSLTRTLNGGEAAQLQMDLPQLALSAELQGIDTSFPNVLMDEDCLALRSTVEHVFTSRPEMVGVETPPASTALNLVPEMWRQRRAQLVRQVEWRKRLIWAGGAYVGMLFLLFLTFLFMRFQVGHLKRQIARDEPAVEFIRSAANDWKTLAPAVDPHYYPLEIILNLSKSLPSEDVHITQYTQSARQISVAGEANSPALAYQFAEKVKKTPELRSFQFEMGTPQIMGNGHAQFRLEGKPR